MGDSQIEERVLQYIKDHPNSDGIDITDGLGLSVVDVYPVLYRLQQEAKIFKRYIGMRTYYEILVNPNS